MQIDELQGSFNRAFEHCLQWKKLAFVSTVLAFCGILVVFCRALAMEACDWISMSLNFLPVFLSGGVFLAMGVILVRNYHDDVKGKTNSYAHILKESWEIVLAASYFSIPIIMAYLLLWMLLGFFYLLHEIPGVGDFFVIMLAFGPFLLNLGSLLLCILSLAALYFVTPAIALKSMDPLHVSQVIVRRVRTDVFSNILLACVACIPLAVTVLLLSIAAWMTGSHFVESNETVPMVIQWFIIMIPFAGLLSPAVTFFFNFAVEAHLILKRQVISQEGSL
jgi:hypothetical protein